MKKILFIIAFLISLGAYSQAYSKYQRLGKLTTAQRNTIDVSDTSVIYTCYNTTTNQEEINTGSGWVARNPGGGGGAGDFASITGSIRDNASASTALDSTVHKWGNETIDSVKTFLRTIESTPRLVTVLGKNTHYEPFRLNGTAMLILQKAYWNGSAFIDASSFGFGHGAIANNQARFVTGGGKNAAQNNTGESAAGFGDSALTNNTGTNTFGGGFSAGFQNTGNNGTFTGAYAGRSNTQTDVTGNGFYSAANNTGTYSTFTGSRSGQFNSGNISTGTGFYSLLYNAGLNSNGFGYYALNRNNGDRNNGFGNYALQYAKGTDNNVFGNSSYSEFIPNISGNKTFGTSDVNTGTDQITVTAHSFGTIGAVVNLKLSGAGVYLGTGMGDGSVNKWEVIDANTLKAKFVDITSTGTGTMTLTPQFAYSNVNILGNNLQPTQSDQTILGGATVVGPNTNKAAGIAGGNKVFLTREMGDQLYTGGGGGGTITLPLDATDIADGSVTNTEFQYINTLTGNVQTQLDGKLDPTDILDEDDMVSNSDTHVPSQQSVKAYVDAKDALKLNLSGGTMLGSIDFAGAYSINGAAFLKGKQIIVLENNASDTEWGIGNNTTNGDLQFAPNDPLVSETAANNYQLNKTGNPVNPQDLTDKQYVDAQLSGSGSSVVAERSLNAGKYHFTSTASNETLTSALVEPATPNLGKKMWRTYTANDTITVPGDLPIGWSSVIEAGTAVDSILIKADTGVDIYGQGNSFVQSGTGIDGLWLKKGRTVALIYKGANSVRAEGVWNVATLSNPELYTASNAIAIATEANSVIGITSDANWTPTSVSSSPSPHTGTYSALFTHSGTANQSRTGQISLAGLGIENGSTYKIGMWINKVSDNSFGDGEVFLWSSGGWTATQTIANLSSSITSNTWYYYEVTGTTSSTSPVIRVDAKTSADPGFKIAIDGLTVIKQ